MTKKKIKKPHYVNNKDFHSAMVDWKDTVNCAIEGKKTPPRITNYIGECFLKIANGLSHRPNFAYYSYRDEMVSDGIENCIRYADRFNPEKSKNPFAYFTQIIYFAFLRRIEKEKKQSRVRDKMIRGNTQTYSLMEGDNQSYTIAGIKSSHFWKVDEVITPPPIKKKVKPQIEKGLEKFMTTKTKEKELVI